MKTRMLFVFAAAWASCVGVNAQTSRQETYNQAQAAFDRREWGAAVAGFREALSGMPSGSRSRGLIEIRLAQALLNSGKTVEAHALASEAVAILARNAPAQDDELASAYLTLGDAARFDLSYAEAIRAYADAQTRSTTASAAEVRRSAAIGTMMSSITTDPDLAARTADNILDEKDYFDALPKKKKAELLATRARIELVRGNPKAALPFLTKALSFDGPLSPKISLSDVAVRADAALVYERLGDDDNTRLYLTYTGAGHLPSNDWLYGIKELPVCGPDVKPEDTAVVEFAIGDDGRTVGAAPVYVSRPGEIGVIFAQAVRNWRWDQRAVAKLDPFWRSSIRLQLRCMTRPPAEPLSKPFADVAANWLSARAAGSVEGADVASSFYDALEAAGLKALREALEDVATASKPGDWEARSATLDAMLVRMNAPVDVRVMAAAAATGDRRPHSMKGNAELRADRLARLIPKVDAMPGGARAAAWLRTERAVALETGGRFDEARTMLEAVNGLPPAALSAEDPIRKVAVLHLSLIDRHRGDTSAADAKLAKSGITADQCDLFDVQPVPANVSIASSQFPLEALRWKFEGYVREAFDIAPDGSVKQVRTVLAYPPFVFAAATEKAVARFRYIPPTLNGEVLGCTSQTQNVRYLIPH